MKAANGLDIPYVGYLELDVQVFGRTIPGRGILVVKDPLNISQQDAVPGLLGMNVIGECYHDLLAKQGEALFSSLDVDKAKADWGKALRYCYRLEACPVNSEGRVCVLERAGAFIPAGSLKFVKVTCPKVPYTPPQHLRC